MTDENTFDPFADGELLRVSPTTAPQQEIIAATKMSDEANTAFNEAIALRIDGTLDIKLLETCFNVLVSRHDILRATFSPAGDELCLQEARNFTIDYEDLRKCGDAEKARVVDSLLKNIAISPMSLEEGPLFFVWVKHLEDTSYELIIATHHVVCDGWSFGLLLKELVEIYRSGGNAEKLDNAPSFFDFAEHQAASSVTNLDTDYWLDRFNQLPPTLDLPLDRPRPSFRTFSAKRFDYYLEKNLVVKLPKVAAGLKSSVVNFVLAGYFSLLYRLTGNQDIVVGLPVAGQAAFNKLNLFGHMVQLIPIRVQFDGNFTFSDLLKQVKEEVISASEHPNFTFGKLLENFSVDRSRVPLISTIFNIDQASPALDFGTASATVRSVPRAAESFEIFLNIVPSPEKLFIEATYSSALFSEETVAAWLKALEEILVAAVNNHQQKLDDFILSPEPPDIVKKFNQTEMENQFDDLISAFNFQQSGSSESLAVISDDQTLTYRELGNLVSQLALYLSGQGIKEGDIVGVCCQRSSKLLISTLAILRLGAAYLPLDPDFPQDRLVYMIEDSAAIAVIEDDNSPIGVREAKVSHININNIDIPGLCLGPPPELDPVPDRLAYIIYTSGSTGKPKGVKVQNCAMINFLESMAKTPGFSNNDRLLAVTTLSFDISVLELFLPLIVGGTTIVASSEGSKDGESLANLIEKHKITVMQATPSTWRLLLASSWGDENNASKNHLKALCGGEPLPPSLADELLPSVSELWNMYGPTETTVWSTCKQINMLGPFISIGHPIANTQIYILDSKLNSLPISVPGELCIGGRGVTLGYHNRPELNAERFIFHPKYGQIYRTGDLAKVLPSAEIQHLGRMDDQVKLRGYRIELGEIESALTDCQEVRQAAVYLWELSEQDVRIVACCVPATVNTLETITLRKKLRTVLPNYMIPQYFINVDEIPLTPNGKIDRRLLPRPQINESSILSKGKLQNDTEKLIAKVWADLLKLQSNIGREDNFFELGGHSLLALAAIRRIEKATGARLELTHFITGRLSSLADKVASAQSLDEKEKGGPVALPITAKRHLSHEQFRLLMRQLNFPENTSNNLPAAWLLEGEFNLDAFKNSLIRLFERQTALRSFISQNNKSYNLSLFPVSELEILEIEDFSEKPEALEKALNDAEQLAKQPFEVINHQLFRMKLYKVSDSSFLLIFIPHQLIFDGWSFDIFLSELDKYYEAALEGKAASLESLLFPFRDFAEWSFNRQPENTVLSYHQKALQASQHNDISVKNIDLSKKGCVRQDIKLDQQSLQKIEEFCEKHQFRIYEVLLSAFAKSYSRLVKDEEFCIGLPVTGRYTPEVIGLVGSFVSTLPAELKIYGDDLVTITSNVAEQLKIFYNHQDLSLAELVKNTPFESQPFPSLISLNFAFQDVRNRPAKLANLKLSQFDIFRHQTEVPIEFWTRVQKNGLLLVFDYDNGQVEADVIDFLGKSIADELKLLSCVGKEAKSEDTETRPPETKKSLWRRLFQ